jgi:iron(III) transport system substrate-binding protein
MHRTLAPVASASASASAIAIAIMAAAAQADEVNVYSSRQPELIKPLVDAFEAETGHQVNTVFLEEGMIERLRAEGDRSPADLVFTVDISRLTELKAAGLTQPVESAVLLDNIPAEMRDQDNQWFGLTGRARLIYASKERVEQGEVTTYEDLASDTWEGRICTRPGTHVYTLGLVGAMIAHHGEDYTKAWLQGVKENLARKPQGNDRAQVKAIWAGECDIALGNNYYMAAMLGDDEQRAWAESVDVVFPEFEDGGTHMNISGMAMTQSAPNRDAAVELMEFLASPEGQKIYAEINAEYPVLASVEPSALVQSWGDMQRDDIALNEIAENRATALRLVEEVGFDR